MLHTQTEDLSFFSFKPVESYRDTYTLMLEGVAVHIWIIHSSLVWLNLEYLTNRADDDVMSGGWQRMFWIPEKQRSYSFSFVVGLLSFIAPIPICLDHTCKNRLAFMTWGLFLFAIADNFHATRSYFRKLLSCTIRLSTVVSPLFVLSCHVSAMMKMKVNWKVKLD